MALGVDRAGADVMAPLAPAADRADPHPQPLDRRRDLGHGDGARHPGRARAGRPAPTPRPARPPSPARWRSTPSCCSSSSTSSTPAATRQYGVPAATPSPTGALWLVARRRGGAAGRRHPRRVHAAPVRHHVDLGGPVAGVHRRRLVGAVGRRAAQVRRPSPTRSPSRPPVPLDDGGPRMKCPTRHRCRPGDDRSPGHRDRLLPDLPRRLARPR